MESDYWKEQETQDMFKKWLGFYEGCLACDCGHGCRDWINEQRSKIALFMRIMSNPNSTTSLDKLAQMPLEKANKIWHRLSEWDCYRMNRNLKDE